MTKHPTLRYEELTLEAAKLRRSADSLSQALKLTEDKIADLYAETLTLPKPSGLVDTDWAKNFKDTNPNQYLEALEYVLHPQFSVIVQLSDQLESPVFAIIAVIDGVASDFWLSAFEKVEDALNLVKEMGWKCL